MMKKMDGLRTPVLKRVNVIANVGTSFVEYQTYHNECLCHTEKSLAASFMGRIVSRNSLLGQHILDNGLQFLKCET
jgi:hypothetical protein